MTQTAVVATEIGKLDIHGDVDDLAEILGLVREESETRYAFKERVWRAVRGHNFRLADSAKSVST